MSAALAQLRTLHQACQQACVVTTCCSGDCTLNVPREGTLCSACDRCDCFGQTDGEKRSDYIILHRNQNGVMLHWLVIEMKSRPRRPGSIIEQLQTGARILQDHERFRLTQQARGLVPILVKAKGIKDSDLAAIRQGRIHFHGKPYPIRIANCGTSIATLISAGADRTLRP